MQTHKDCPDCGSVKIELDSEGELLEHYEPNMDFVICTPKLMPLPCRDCGGRGPHKGPGHSYRPVHITTGEIRAVATAAWMTMAGTRSEAHEQLMTLLEKLDPEEPTLLHIKKLNG